jgi:intracellular multiplication protein IcmP
MPAAPQGGGNQGDNSAGILWGIAAFFAAVGGVWYVFKTQIVSLYLLLKFYELNFLSYISSFITHNPYYFEQLKASILSARANPSSVSFNNLLALGSSVGDWLRYPIILLLFILAVVVYVGNTARVYRRTYSMRDFAKLESTNWPQITPVIHLDLIKADIDAGPWAMAMTPLQFCKRYKLLEEVRPERREGMNRKDRDRIEVILKRGESNKLFSLQLGPLWKGAAYLPPYAKALFAVFAARINADSQAAANLLVQLSSSSLNKELNIAGTDELLKKHEKTKLVQKIVESHAYVTTVMASMLEAARADGVQASADFLWLKPRDRKLWYTLNTVGRQTPFIEVGGIFAHWVAEKQAGRKLLMPMVDEATNAVELALKEVVYKPDEG